MIFPISFLAALCGVLFFISRRLRGREKTNASLAGGLRMLTTTLPLLILGLLSAGFLEVVVPPEFIQNWMGENAGVKGYVTSMVAGILLPGGPYVTFPIIGAVFRAGAGLGPAVTFVTSWAVLSVGFLVFEIPFVGLHFTLIRLLLVFWVPIAAGLLAQLFFG
ncbi:MAG: permease [Desulfobacterales bacterium]|nr:permease [Desulfobacterales bacterium]